MEPLRFAYPISNWLLRVALLIMIYMIFFGTYRNFNTSDYHTWIAVGFGLFAILLFIGGFMKKHTLTIISAILLTLGCCYKIFMHFAFGMDTFVAIWAIFGAITLFFAASGNRKK
jgi:hypothetical protein